MNKPNPNATEVPPQDEQEQRADCAARYLRGELNPAEVEAFEITLLEDPRLFEEVLLQCQLQAGLEEHQEALNSAAKITNDNGLPSIITHSGKALRQKGQSGLIKGPALWASSWGQLARAAGMAFLALGLVVQTVRLQYAADELASYRLPRLGIPVFAVYKERSYQASQAVTITAKPGQSEVVLQIDADAEDAVDIELRRASGTLIQKFTQVTPADSGFVNLTLPISTHDRQYQMKVRYSKGQELTYQISIVEE